MIYCQLSASDFAYKHEACGKGIPTLTVTEGFVETFASLKVPDPKAITSIVVQY